ncbi:glycosyl hydrolase family 16 [Coprinopsis cinerea okayama7|uniref:Glycosyl hydrolase family 16 n=1 Tax=Coprinopsis cinerea (strain Okayama-7 / 130 / ATCC MYA-4618 / FGSC 9003) TaxID=240176 RepID=A8P019_COPC7|nr:glycosyl hydrolase family 16 [Coprinopsis cinerea okayama7\|eukprot:XP_001837802.2 glycosyl hydrolase family 16 [Coprinopsis cinerea okayama7\
MHLQWPRLASATTLLCLAFFASPSTASRNRSEPLERRNQYLDRNRDGTPFVWLLEDDYKGHDFFDHFEFFNWTDPTKYVSREEAFARRLAYVQDDGIVVMKADDTSHLPRGEFRSSVRINTIKRYTTGLFILDLNTAPWGCGVWPAWWSTGDNWPVSGEIDIIEGVHDNEHNQIAWHTEPGCVLDTEESFTGNVSIKSGGPAVECNAHINQNAGCSITEWSRASYGPYFDEQGGGVFAMKWDENGIAVWSFYRAAIPKDITEGNPNPRNWGDPSALLGPGKCNIMEYFRNHTVILNITFCGDWAGNSYATSGCPGTCPDRLMDPANFVNATWSINSMKVYRKQPIYAEVVDPNKSAASRNVLGSLALVPLVGAALMN